MLLSTTRLQVERLADSHARRLCNYLIENREFLEPWEPLRDDEYYSERSCLQRIRKSEEEHGAGLSLRLVAFEPDGHEIVGLCDFTNISRGPFQACNVGYSIARKLQGNGLMTEFLAASVEYVFDKLCLHRVMANYMPENKASARVLEKLQFEVEGYAKSYLMIAGHWRDHVLTAKVEPSARSDGSFRP